MEELEQQSTSLEPRPHLLPGTKLCDRYQLIRPVAAGGFGAVYLAEQILTGRRVAIKVLHAWLAHDDHTRERFRRELSAPAEIDHPGIVDVIDADVDPTGTPFLVMEWLEGQTLRQRLKEGACSLTELRDLFAPLLSALEAAHDAGFVHRDLKPENVIIARGPDGVERPRIVDFGLARRTGAKTVTVTGTSLGTPRYMSPEQFMDSKAVGPAADVWSVGIMMYEALTGASPFEAEGPHQLMLKILVEPHVPVNARLPGCPSRLAALIDACLEKEASNRPANARAMRSLFLGAYAAISGGVDLRTIPEMPMAKAPATTAGPDQATAAPRPRPASPPASEPPTPAPPGRRHPTPAPSPFAAPIPEPAAPLPVAAPRPSPAPALPSMPSAAMHPAMPSSAMPSSAMPSSAMPSSAMPGMHSTTVPRTQSLAPGPPPARKLPAIVIIGPIVAIVGILLALGIGLLMFFGRAFEEPELAPPPPYTEPLPEAPAPVPMAPIVPAPAPAPAAREAPRPEPSRGRANEDETPLSPITAPIDRLLQ